MRVFRRLPPLSASPHPRAVALGNFDGLHLGHQRLLRLLVRHARKYGYRSLLLTFSPHPEKVLDHGRVLMIQTLERRLEIVRSLGVEEVLIMPFNADFAALSPGRFMSAILVKALGARAVFVGPNFRFGRGRKGTVRTLSAYGRRTGRFEVFIVPPVRRGGRVVSSSLIRRLLEKGEVEAVRGLLGRPYEISGRVVAGRSVGRRLGFPTANLRSRNEILPFGIFLSLAYLGGRPYPALTYIGRRPTFRSGRNEISVETYLLHFRGRLYGRPLTILFLKKLRDEKSFPDAVALASQIKRDVRRAEAYFLSRSFSSPPI